MIQVCSQCGTRWNVRDKQRSWCPRCNGTLLAPEATAPSPPAGPNAWRPGPRSGPRLPPGYRWIAVRPGPPPPPRRRRKPLGPTPRYLGIPRWGLVDRVNHDSRPRPRPAGGADPGADPQRVLRGRGRVGRGSPGACAALPAVGHQPRHLAELVGRRCGGTAQRAGQPGRGRRGDDVRVSLDPMVDRPTDGGIRACRPIGTPWQARVVGRHAAASVGRDGAGHHFSPWSRRRRGTPPVGR